MIDNKHEVTTSDREIITTRIFDAPRELAFEVWTKPEHITNWWGPNGFTTTIHEMDFRPGGTWDFIMHGPDGANYINKYKYGEIIKPELITYTHLSVPVFHGTVTFEALGDKTKITMHMVFESAAEFERVVRVHNAIEGGKQTFNRLGEYLKKKQSQNK